MPINRPYGDAGMRCSKGALYVSESKFLSKGKQDRLRPPNPKPLHAVELNRLPIPRTLYVVDAIDLLLQQAECLGIHRFPDSGQQLRLKRKESSAGCTGHYVHGAISEVSGAHLWPVTTTQLRDRMGFLIDVLVSR